MIKVGLISLGCAKNLVDSEIILGMLDASKFECVNTIEESDVIIINTCGFIEASKQESIENILDIVRLNEVNKQESIEPKKLVVTGCLVERYKEELKQSIPEVDLWISIKEYPKFNEKLEELLGIKKIEKFNPFVRLLSTPKYMAYLRISEGCNNRCAYCAIPLIRGAFKSRPFEDLVFEAKNLYQKGIKELVVISQDTTRYGSDLNEGKNIVDLLRGLEAIGFYSIRLLYLYPDEISDELIDYIASSKAVKPYFDIPLQHASNKILKAMYRRGTMEDYQILIDKIRNKIPNAILRTTYIVGFAGEDDEDFKTLIEFTQKNHFDHMGAFKYSKEDNTPAYSYTNQIKENLKELRLAKLMEVQKKISYKNNKARIGEIMEGIVIDYNKSSNVYMLRSYWNAPDDIDGNISFTSKKPLNIGDIVKVKITSAFVYDLFGEAVE